MAPENCKPCDTDSRLKNESSPSKIKHGVEYRGIAYHIRDFVLYEAEKGAANLGQIVEFQYPRNETRSHDVSVIIKVVKRSLDRNRNENDFRDPVSVRRVLPSFQANFF
jgi:hypothetical protein